MTPSATADNARMKNIIVCADDYALHPAASQGIVALARRQRLSATSVMALSPRWAKDARPLRELQGQISVGLHLDWTSPFARAAGHGLNLGQAMRAAVFGGFARQATQTLIERQLDAFEAHWRAPPDHVDGHQHVQQFAGLREALLSTLLRRYGHTPGGARPWLRVSRPAPGQADLKARIIAAWGARPLQRQARAQGLRCTTTLCGVYDFQGNATRYRSLLRHWLHSSPHGALLMCHPAWPDGSSQIDMPGLAPTRWGSVLDDIAPARAIEFSVWNSEELPAMLAEAGVQLVSSPQPLRAPPPEQGPAHAA